MKHPEILLVPALMISDYLLTIAGARLRQDAYGKHFKSEQYELNPLWRSAVSKLRWINFRHLILTALVTALMIALWEFLDAADPVLPYLMGFVIGIQGTINGRHLGNLAIFSYLKRHPAEISGEVRLTHGIALWLSSFQLFAVLLPLALLAAYSPRPAVIGALVGVIALVLVHFLWIARHRRRLVASQDAPSA